MEKWTESGQLGTILVELVRIGTYVQLAGKQADSDQKYVILASETNQEESGETGKFGNNLQITTDYHLLPVSEEGDDISSPDIPSIWCRRDEIVII